ncbi:MAG: hypothetical protein LUQ31_10165 [Methanoregula sp.]|nr:hypothetical protein [Methanoregula sp.]
MSIGVCYSDHYANEETFQFFKILWEWNVPGRDYDVVISSKPDVSDGTGKYIDLTGNEQFEL